MKKMILLLCLFATKNTFAVPQSYTTSEHIEIGNQIKLHLTPQTRDLLTLKLPLQNGLRLTYGEIISLADFYGIPGEPIALLRTQTEKRAHFLRIFNTLATTPTAVEEVPKILAVAQQEKALIDNALLKNESIEEAYAKTGFQFEIQYNCITGGGCLAANWLVKQGRFLKLLSMDYDHFGEHAWEAYEIGHRLALETATIAGSHSDYNKLLEAYALNAYACHYLTDRFSTGHMRTPRIELPTHVSPKIVGSLLVNFMHNEENHYGLHVRNARGDWWMAYGDKSYFINNAQTHRKLLEEALQISADEIYSSFANAKITTNNQVEFILPFPIEVKSNNRQDISPLFFWDEQNKIMYRRKQLASPYDRNYTKSWWGWSTLIELKRQQSFGYKEQSMLAHSACAEKALNDGLITETSLQQFIQKTLK